MSEGHELEAPLLLLAMPQVMDRFFQKSVVLLVHHSDEGSVGFIINRPMPMGIVDVLDGMDLPWSGDREAVVHFGGPVQPQLGTLLFATESTSSETSTQVLPGLALSQHSGDLAALAAAPPELFRLFLGYAGWGAGQLVEEILRNDWLIAPVDDRFIFSADPSAVWDAALRSVGISPEALPSWTGGGGSAN